MFFEKIKNTITNTLKRMLSKDKKRISYEDYDKYEEKFLNEYLVYDRDCFEFLKLVFLTEYGTGREKVRYPISLEKIQIIQDFKCLSTFGSLGSPVIMKKLIDDPSKRGKQLLDDLRSFRKRYELVYENLEDYIGNYRKTLNQIDENIVFSIIHYNRTERVEALIKKYSLEC